MVKSRISEVPRRPITQEKRMDHKLEILTASLPKAMLQALTPEAIAAVPSHFLRGDMIAMFAFPFKIGRESRVAKVDGRLVRMERPKKDDGDPSNDVYLIDRGHRLNISREHFEIVKKDGAYFLVDRGSACGTKIGGRNVGGDDVGGTNVLHDGDEIAVGAVGTPYVFRFISFDEYCVARKTE
ncbi:MAG: FHA domain-containing protein [Proteobacteria bacterium]|nr:FHA domain-containing protein [Pseudomonadota bacterium]